jgi:excisionase family DNA binding protein
MPKTIGNINLYSILELSKLLKVTDVTLRKYIKNGKLKAQKIGGAYYITEDNLKLFLNGKFEKPKGDNYNIEALGKL